ncbi:hypothetical protein A3J23_02470 [Candidatus Peregrinibacteria bacterium RIFCSPLOWO2_02_FULL_48_14]|nr:MAG: hypothetical protein A2974_00380 [Candidatus Peregrinibacteria bacterium RIFCSPLOWO2_01_FULL_48_20]OGJ45818.1 MAG: hypothetical protein A3J23_02470 [Candidatus Peregrinibacteria bacterium RIFCSPLOWO2_02_FULL_48_14]
MNNLTIKMPERLKKKAQSKAKAEGITLTFVIHQAVKAYNDGKLEFGLMHSDDEITASFDVTTKEGKKACLTSFKALAQ